MDENLYPQFISDKPLGDDLLDGKSHDKIAKSIAQYISKYSDQNLIGIDGSWGSGKSNVIEILREKYLSETHNIFVFDAWGHQEDLQRRAILEELTKFLIFKKSLPPNTEYKLLNGDKKNGTWQERLTYLLSRKKNTFHQVTPHLSKGLIISILVTILTPIAKTISDSLNYCPTFSFVITALPLFIGLLTTLFFLYISKNKIKWSEFINIYKDSEQTKDIYEIISENEPNINEFREWINSISESILHGERPKKLIIVFDNMDRLPSEKVQALWSSIHAFFAECHYPNIWVIIPFDRVHIKDAFKSDEEKTNHFINKTFTAIYRIPPPILTDWHKFFKLKFEDAFGNNEVDEYNIVKSIFDITQDNITPRNIISFINSIVSEKKLEGCEVKLRYIAAFSAYKKEILNNPVNEILMPSFESKIKNLFKGDNDFSDNIAALVYNLPVDSARQITLTLDLKNTLKEKNLIRINEYAKQKHFIEMLEKVINQEELDIENTILTIGAIEHEAIIKLDAQKLLIIWDTLCGMQQSIPLNKQEFTESQRLLLLNISANRKIAYFSYLANEISIIKDFSGVNYYEALHEIDIFIKENKYDINVYSFLNPIEKTPDIFLDFVKSSEEEYPICKLTCKESELMTFLIEKIPSALNDLNQIQFIASDFDFSDVIIRIEESINNNEVTIENITDLFLLYKTINDDSLLEFIADDQIYTLINSAEPSSKAFYELISIRLARGSSFTPAYNKGVCLNSLATVEEVLILEVAERIECYADYDDLLLEVIKWPQPLLIAVIKSLTLNSTDDSTMEIVEVLPNFNNIVNTLGITHAEFINTLDGWSEYAKEKINAENISSIIPDFEFFEHAVEIDNDLTNHSINVMTENLNKISKEDWMKYLINESSFYFRVLHLLLIKNIIAFPKNAIIAYKELLLNIARENTDKPNFEKWDILFDKINKNTLKSQVRNIRDVFTEQLQIKPDLFVFFSKYFLLSNTIDEEVKCPVVTRRILTPVIENPDCLNLILGNADYYANIIKKADDDSEDFKDKIRLLIESSTGNELLENFAKKIGIIRKTDQPNIVFLTNKNNPQWTSYKEYDLKNRKLETIKLELLFKSDYLRFGFKLLDQNAKLFGEKGLRNTDNNFLIHLVKPTDSNKITCTAYFGFEPLITDIEATEFNKNKPIIIELNIDENNNAIFKVGSKECYKTTISPDVRSRLYILAWGDYEHEYEMHANKIRIKTVD